MLLPCRTINRRKQRVSAEMTERSIVTDCKSVARLGYIGSNPILGTKNVVFWDENKLVLFSA